MLIMIIHHNFFSQLSKTKQKQQQKTTITKKHTEKSAHKVDRDHSVHSVCKIIYVLCPYVYYGVHLHSTTYPDQNPDTNPLYM